MHSQAKPNPSNDFVIEEIFGIHRVYCQRISPNAESAPIILKVKNHNESNLFEHNSLKAQMLLKFGVQMVDIDFNSFEDKLTLDETNGKLCFSGREVSVVYFRTGYQEDFYIGESPPILRFREMTEKSLAINIPSVKVHLLNMKLVQKFLLMDSFLDVLRLKPENVANIRRHSTEILNVLSDFDLDKARLIERIQGTPNQ